MTEDFTEFKWLPFVIGILGLLFLRAAVARQGGHLVDVTILYIYFGCSLSGHSPTRCTSTAISSIPRRRCASIPSRPRCSGDKTRQLRGVLVPAFGSLRTWPPPPSSCCSRSCWRGGSGVARRRDRPARLPACGPAADGAARGCGGDGARASGSAGGPSLQRGGLRHTATHRRGRAGRGRGSARRGISR